MKPLLPILLSFLLTGFASKLCGQLGHGMTLSCAELASRDSILGSFVVYLKEPVLLDTVGLRSCLSTVFENSTERNLLAEIEGKPVYRLRIDVDGRVARMCYLRMPHPLMDETYRKCLLDLRYKPAIDLNEEKAECWVNLLIPIPASK